MYVNIISILIIGTVIFTGTVVFAGKNYNSSKSNTTTIAIVNQQVGDILLRYGIGGAEINKVTDALAVGISEAELEDTLLAIGIGEKGVSEVFAKLDKLGAGFIKLDDEEKAISTSNTEDTSQTAVDAFFDIDTAISTSDTKSPVQSVEEIEIAVEQIKRSEVSTSDSETAGISPKAAETGTIKEILPSKRAEPVSNEIEKTEVIEFKQGDDSVVVRKKPGRTTYANITLKRAVFHEAAMNIVQNIRSAAPEERENLINELRDNRGTFQTEIVSMSLSIRENAKELRENFRKNVRAVIGHVDHGKTARIAVAHGKGLRMINRFRSATARFDHILGRLESRVEKLEARDVDVPDVIALIEEAKNMQVENEATMEELKAKYESLLEGENPKEVAEEARAIAKELKTEIETLHAKLREITDGIKQAVKNFNSSKSNTSI